MKLKVFSLIASVIVGAATLAPLESHAMGGGSHGGMMGGGFRGGMMGGGFRGGMMGGRIFLPHGGSFNGGMIRGRMFPVAAFHRQQQVGFFRGPHFAPFPNRRFAFFHHRRHFGFFGGFPFFPAGYADGYAGDYATGYAADYCVWRKVWVNYAGWRWRQVCNDYGY
jgi:hypothetical protein